MEQLQQIELLLEAILDQLRLARLERALRDPVFVETAREAQTDNEGAQDV